MNNPPQSLDGARVLEFAVIDDSVKFTGRLELYRGDEPVGPVPRLVIAQNPEASDLLLLHCDMDWNVLGVQAWNAPDKPPVTSVEEVKRRAEQYYIGLSSKWVRLQAQ